MGPSSLFSLQSTPLCFSSSISKFSAAATTVNLPPKCKNPIVACMADAPPAAPPSTCLGFKNLLETFRVDVQRAEGRPLNVPLIAPFTIASSRLDRVENVAIRVELANGCVGWGESPILPHVTAEDQPTALYKAAEACLFLKQSSGKTLGLVLSEINGILPGHSFASVSFSLDPFSAFGLKFLFCA
ncbi:L-Ala-D/L-amino acid epimerase [Sesamum angolense]|uniref:L-Ala-D/L-amino acid epimerase n=1 Tax=Sesamum angolense TaxID=2727404 RepID=A0AAE2BSD4_9LAMI|nr:L-Ala-D/L-amino acid epimerase [Sesamum angolense]